MAGITASTTKDKRENIKHQFSQSLVLLRDFIYEIQSLIFTYHELVFYFNSSNAKDFHKGGNTAFGLISFNFMQNTKERSLWICKIV